MESKSNMQILHGKHGKPLSFCPFFQRKTKIYSTMLYTVPNIA